MSWHVVLKEVNKEELDTLLCTVSAVGLTYTSPLDE